MSDDMNRRILLVDDTETIHEDFRKVLKSESPGPGAASFQDDRAAFFGEEETVTSGESFDMDSATQGQQAHQMVKTALAESRPYAMAFVDVRMPPGWDGIETIEHLWSVDPDLQVVICTAYSDYSWDQIVERMGNTDRLLILKKPFDAIEVTQMGA
jgi:CheY-like chemotaxis protein